MSVCVCMHVRERERERECVCVCVCVCERERERDRERECVCVCVHACMPVCVCVHTHMPAYNDLLNLIVLSCEEKATRTQIILVAFLCRTLGITPTPTTQCRQQKVNRSHSSLLVTLTSF